MVLPEAGGGLSSRHDAYVHRPYHVTMRKHVFSISHVTKPFSFEEGQMRMGGVFSDHVILHFLSCVATPQKKNKSAAYPLDLTKRQCPRCHLHLHPPQVNPKAQWT